MSDVKNAFVALGLSEDEVAIYMSLLERGEDTILHLAQKTAIPRTSVYVAVEGLVGKQLIDSRGTDGKKKFFACPPSALLDFGKVRQTQLTESIAHIQEEVELLEILHTPHSGKPRLHFAGEIQQMIPLIGALRTSKECHVFQTVEGSIKGVREIYQALSHRLQEKQTSLKVLCTQTSPLASSKAQSYLKEFRILPERFLGLTDIIIADSTVVQILPQGNAVTMLSLDDALLANSERTRFMVMWDFFSAIQKYS